MQCLYELRYDTGTVLAHCCTGAAQSQPILGLESHDPSADLGPSGSLGGGPLGHVFTALLPIQAPKWEALKTAVLCKEIGMKARESVLWIIFAKPN